MASATLTAKLVGDAKGLVDAFGKAERATGDLDRSTGKISATMGAARGQYLAAAGAVGAGAAAIGGAFVVANKFVSAASDMSESASKVNVVFGDQAAVIQKWSEGSAKNMGLARQSALEAAGTFGNLFSAMGVGQDESTKLSTSVVQLAADFASFNNIGTDQALEKLRAGLVGEAEPLRALGVNINAATVEAKALEMGAKKVNGELTEGAKVQARYALIVEQSKNAQGDFARTSGGLANQQRILSAEIANLKVKIGEDLLPVVLDGTRELTKFLDAHSEDIARGIARGVDAIGDSLRTIVNSGPYRIAVEFVGGALGIGSSDSAGLASRFANWFGRNIGEGAVAPFKIADLWTQQWRGWATGIGDAWSSRPAGVRQAEYDRQRYAGSGVAVFGGMEDPEPGRGDFLGSDIRDKIAAINKLGDSYQEYFNQLRSANVPLDEARKRTAELAAANGSLSAETIDAIRTGRTMEDTFQQLRRTTSVLTEATKVAAAAEDDLARVRGKIASEQLSAEIAAYLEGGEKKLAAVRNEQALQQAAIEMTAARIQKVFGVDVATSLEFAFAHVTNAASAMREKVASDAQAMASALGAVISGISPGSQVEEDLRNGAMSGLSLYRDAQGNQSWYAPGNAPGGYQLLVDPRALGYQGPTLLGSGAYSPAPSVTVNIQALDGQSAADATVRVLGQLESEGRISTVTVVH